MKKFSSRRNFLRNLAGAGCASLSLTPFLSGITNLGLINALAAANKPSLSLGNTSNYKALVCIFLSGGNDSYNMLIPRDKDSYEQYKETRGTMAIPKEGPKEDDNLLPIYPTNDSELKGKEFCLHPKMKKIRDLFNDEKYISFVANVGHLLRPNYTSVDFNKGANVPHQLFSHSDQAKSWQTGIPQGHGRTGWAGRMADILHSCNDNADISMNISLNRSNIFQRGKMVTEYTIQESGSGSVLLNGTANPNTYQTIKQATLDSIYEETYQGILENAYANELKSSLENSNAFSCAINGVNDFTESFPTTSIGNQLKMVAKTIAARNNTSCLGNAFSRQTFFVTMDGFDNHSELRDKHDDLMEELDKAIYAFYKAMEELETSGNLDSTSDEIVGFTMSDFARTLTSNGDGTDHAWGGHTMVFGNAIDGGKILGTYPCLDLGNNPLHINGGRLIPTTSCDEYFADLALWFASNGTGENCDSSLTFSQLKAILPNIGNFCTSTNNVMTDRLGLFA